MKPIQDHIADIHLLRFQETRNRFSGTGRGRLEIIMKTPRRLVPAYLAAFALSICLLPQDHAAAETLQVNGIEMYYQIMGEGEPLILLHG